MAAVSPNDFHISERIQRLAEPKKIKDVWNYCNRLVWGNQETIWHLPPRALTCQPSTRILDLAKPKKRFERTLLIRPSNVLSSGWRSKIWEGPLNSYDHMPSERILQLSEPKQYSPIYLEQRPRSSPMWPVSPSALCCKASQRLLDLSQPRPLNSSFVLPKEAQTQVGLAARSTAASPRMQLLARPVIKKSIPCYENRFVEAPIRKVSPAALQAVPTSRLAELARPRALPPESAPDRPAEWPVSPAAKRAMVSPRIGELAHRPARASTNFVQFNPDAFMVKESAKNAYCSERIKKLAEPIAR